MSQIPVNVVPALGKYADTDASAFLVFFSLSALSSEDVKRRLRAMRVQAGLSQAELARLASDFLEGDVLTQVDISRLENAPSKAKLSVLIAVCKALRKTVSDLLEEIPEELEGSGRDREGSAAALPNERPSV